MQRGNTYRAAIRSRAGALLGALLGVVLGFTAYPAGAQVTPPEWDPGSSLATRAELTALLERYEAVLQSSAYGEAIRQDAAAAADRIRERLEQGDFGQGDRIIIELEGMDEEFPDTFRVEAGPSITVPDMGRISLQGVLRHELTDHLTEELGRFIRDPRLQARSTIRLSIQGQVGSPGFYLFPSGTPLGDVFGVAGGLGQEAGLDQMVLERSGEVLLEGEELGRAMARGESLDQLNLRTGDQLTVPEEQTSLIPQIARWGAILGTTLLFGIRVF